VVRRRMGVLGRLQTMQQSTILYQGGLALAQ
jgi:hypothetical protein